MRRILSPLLIFGLVSAVFGQIEIKENPYTFENNSLKNLDVEKRVVLSPGKSIVAALSEDETDSANGLPPRFGLTIETSMNLENSGTWEELPDGSRLWRLQIKSPSAKSINLLYDAFHLPPGGRFHVYNSERTQVIGAFTELNNKGTIDRPGLFATGLVYGDEITLEYYHPKGADLNAIISINSVVHGYKLIKVLQPFDDAQLEKDDKIFGSAPACFVNVNCSPEGNNWQDEKKGIAMIVVGGNRICSGSLINNRSSDRKPYFLTANHCIGSLDSNGNTNASNWIFYWNYESPTCADPVSEPTIHSTTGATLKANRSDSDFALFLLQESPLSACYDVYFNGWDRTTNPSPGGVGIHHPAGDIKKIATYTMDPYNGSYYNSNHWRIDWANTANGKSGTSGGSSGSPLFMNNGRIIGQLHGGPDPSCNLNTLNWDEYGKISSSWDGGSSSRRLRDWLSPSFNYSYMYGQHFNPASIDLTIDTAEWEGSAFYVAAHATGGTAPFKWYINGVLVATTSSNSFSYRYPCEGGSSTLGVVAPTPCGTASKTAYYYEECSGGSHRMAVYPNPADSEINITLAKNNIGSSINVFGVQSTEDFRDVLLTLLDFSGNPVKEMILDEPGEQDVKMDVSSLSKGIYFLRIVGKKLNETHTVVIE